MVYSDLSWLLASGALALSASATEEPVTGMVCNASCTADENGKEVCKFTTKVDLFAGELGYYHFEECGDAVNPTLGVEVGKTYQFIQKDRSN